MLSLLLLLLETTDDGNKTYLIYEWNIVERPALNHSITESLLDPLLQLRDLIAGTYTIK